ncbi:MAG: radical SAM peptide maturase [Mediterranea massiliensis]|nr:radical SAM peptide maturase [Mediterranea massiliensis]
MNNITIFESQNRQHYIYSEKEQYFIYIPDDFKNFLTNKTAYSDSIENEYYMRKLIFLKNSNILEKTDTIFQTEITEEQIKKNLASLRQLLIEVTDGCNLQCKYCAYGEFYSNYDNRKSENQRFENIKTLIDYLVKLWKSEYNVSHNNTVVIGFYGGEPLLNMKLICEIIDYIENLQIKWLNFVYNMTTNAMLLNRYMNYIVKHNFNLLISLDGDENQNSYRINKSGKSSFKHVISNLQKIKETYPEYFEKNVSFNVVLHDRNSIEDSYNFIFQTFGKVPRISELNTNGINPERIEDFYKMFNSRVESFRSAIKNNEIKNAFQQNDTDSIRFHSMSMNYLGNRYATYLDLFDSENTNIYIPTGTCRPFERKLFLTVNNKILPCERIGQNYAIATLNPKELELNCANIAKFYSALYRKVVKNCKYCFSKRTCSQCMFLLKEKDGNLICQGIMTEAKLKKEFSDFLTYAEEHPGDYERLLSSIIID